jgi:hypothetical protein
MTNKAFRASDYPSEATAFVRATCLEVAAALGALMENLVVVGGLVPTFLIDQDEIDDPADQYPGTTDLDIALTFGIPDRDRQSEIASRLRSAGFSPQLNSDGRLAGHRWEFPGLGRVRVDFLIPPPHPGDRTTELIRLGDDFAAQVTDGLDLAFRDTVRTRIAGKTFAGADASFDIIVCGPGAFVVLKALAFRGRGENKDAHDLYYVVRHFGAGAGDVADRLRPLLPDANAQRAIQILRDDFTDYDGRGPLAVARFTRGGPDEDVQADVVGFVGEFLRQISNSST